MANKNIRLHPQERPPHGVLREKHHKNTIFIIALAFLLAAALFCGAAAAHDGHDGIEWTEWTDYSALPSLPGNYYLKSDVTLDRTWSVPEGTTNLCLNGRVIKMGEGGYDVIEICEGATLNLYDCNTTIKHYFNVDSSGRWTLTKQPAEHFVTGGVITGGNAVSGGLGEGIGVSVNGGTFTMNGGNIAGNSSSAVGGGVSVNGSTFTMNGGNIAGNWATMYGGGVYVYVDGATFSMYGGNITENTALGGGGVYINDGTFEVSGDAEVLENSNGRNVYLCTNTMHLTGTLTGRILVSSVPDVDAAFGTAAAGASGAENIIYTGQTPFLCGDINNNDLIWREALTTITYHDGAQTTQQTIKANEVINPQTPAGKEGDTFLGWVANNNKPVFLYNYTEENYYLPGNRYYDSSHRWISGEESLDLYALWASGKGSSPAPTNHKITVTTGITGGSASATYAYAPNGTQITINAYPKTGYNFSKWTVTGATVSYVTTNPATFTVGNSDVTVTPVFESGSPSSGDMTVSYQTGGGSYTLSIPSYLPLTRGVISQAPIRVKDVSVTEGYHVDVTLTSNDVASDDNSKFLLKLTGTNAEDAEYRIANSEEAFDIGPSGLKGPFIKTGDKVLSKVTGNSEVDLFFKLTKDPSTAGKYTGTITFTASVNPDAQAF